MRREKLKRMDSARVESTDAGHRGGAARSRDEGPVMGLDRRSGVVRLCLVGNPKGEDPHG